MTSSLVGSEMCIRDRVWGLPEARSGAAAAGSALPAALAFAVPRVGSVSYTHLTLPTICSV
eukprot:5871569-Prorocentrum_lima.AAC.1